MFDPLTTGWKSLIRVGIDLSLSLEALPSRRNRFLSWEGGQAGAFLPHRAPATHERRQLLSLSGSAADGGMGCAQVSAPEINPSLTFDGCWLLSALRSCAPLPAAFDLRTGFYLLTEGFSHCPCLPSASFTAPTSAGCCSPSRLATNSRHPAPS